MRWKLQDDVTRMGTDKWVEEELRKIGKRKEVQDNVKRVRSLEKMLLDAVPHCPAEVIADVATDLGDLVKVGSKHRRHVNKILKLAGPRTNAQLQDILAEVEVNLLFEGLYHLNSLKRNLRKLKGAVKKASKDNPSKESLSKRLQKK